MKKYSLKYVAAPYVAAPAGWLAFQVACSLVGLLLGRALAGLTARFLLILLICKGQREQLYLARV